MAWLSSVISAISTAANVPALVRVGVGALGLILVILAIVFRSPALAITGTILAGGAAVWPSSSRG